MIRLKITGEGLVIFIILDAANHDGILPFIFLLGFLPRAAFICCSVKKKNNPNPSPILKNWFGLYMFGGISRTRTYDPHDVNVVL